MERGDPVAILCCGQRSQCPAEHVRLAGSKPWRVAPAIPGIFHSPLAYLFMQGNIGKAVPAASFCITA